MLLHGSPQVENESPENEYEQAFRKCLAPRSRRRASRARRGPTCSASDANLCTGCGAGTNTTAKFAVSCSLCVADTFSTAMTATASTSCLRCALGRFSAMLGAAASKSVQRSPQAQPPTSRERCSRQSASTVLREPLRWLPRRAAETAARAPG